MKTPHKFFAGQIVRCTATVKQLEYQGCPPYIANLLSGTILKISKLYPNRFYILENGYTLPERFLVSIAKRPKKITLTKQHEYIRKRNYYLVNRRGRLSFTESKKSKPLELHYIAVMEANANIKI